MLVMLYLCDQTLKQWQRRLGGVWEVRRICCRVMASCTWSVSGELLDYTSLDLWLLTACLALGVWLVWLHVVSSTH